MVVHSQVLKASASEVAAMVEGAVRHGTAMNLAGNYVDSHGQSEIGFGITRLLDIDLLPRIKRINTVRLYRSEPAGPADRFAPTACPPPGWTWNPGCCSRQPRQGTEQAGEREEGSEYWQARVSTCRVFGSAFRRRRTEPGRRRDPRLA